MVFRKRDDYDNRMTWYSPVMLESDWPVYFRIMLEYVEYWGCDEMLKDGKYLASLQAISPVACRKNWPDVIRSTGWDQCQTIEDFEKLNVLMQCDMVSDYGISTTIKQIQGNNKRKLLKAMRAEYNVARMMFGFMMDRTVNGLGNDGWEAIQGDIGFTPRLRELYDSMKPSDQKTGMGIVAKMEGIDL